VSKPLYEDCSRFRPVKGRYSPYGALYGFSSNLVEHMALKTLQSDAVKHFGLEDVFVDGNADKLAWVNGWRKLPHLKREVEAQFDYPQQFAEDIFDRIERALRTRASRGEAKTVHTGRVFILSGDAPDLPIRYIYQDEAQILSDRREGRCVLSYKTPGGWVAVTKSILTEVLGEGQDVTFAGLPPVAAEVLKLMCPLLVSTRLGGP
jgi:hypothetical protein